MNYAVNVLIFLVVTNQYVEETRCLRSRSKTSLKRDPAQVWSNGVGQGNSKQNNVQKTTVRPNPKSSPDPCDPYNPSKPNFKAQYRISQASRALTARKLGYQWRHVIRGRNTSPGEYPHMGAVGWRVIAGTWKFKCGSTLISPKFMLTAGHCSQATTDSSLANPNPEIVRLGDKNIIDKPVNRLFPIDAKILKVTSHPKFAPPIKYYDIAIIELVNEVIFTRYVQPACLWTEFDTNKIGSKATLTGWGVIETAGKNTSPELQAAEVDVINSTFCDQLLRKARNRLWGGFQPHQLCAGKLAGGVDACQGDSGGPLQVKIKLPFKTELSLHYIIGVTSFGIKCARANSPGVYTRVSSFVDWIESIVWKSQA